MSDYETRIARAKSIEDAYNLQQEANEVERYNSGPWYLKDAPSDWGYPQPYIPEYKKAPERKAQKGYEDYHTRLGIRNNAADFAMEYLLLDRGDGWTILHEMARTATQRESNIGNYFKLLTVATQTGWTVAHVLASNCKLSFASRPSYDWLRDYSVLRLADENCWTVAHELARCGCGELIKSNYVLNLKDNNGVSVKEVIDKLKA